MDEFERWVDQAYEALPETIRSVLEREEIPVQIRDAPPASLRDSLGRGTVFGAFVGADLGERRHRGMMTQPTRIEIYERPLRRHFSDPEALQQQVQQTLIHEVGHYLGMDEQQLRELEERL